MNFKSSFFRFASAAFLIFSLGAFVFADTIRLKDGSIIKGKIVNFNGGKFTVVIGDETRQKQLSFSADEVESIVFDANSGSVESVSQNQQNNKPVQQPVSTKQPQTTSTASTNSNPVNKPIEINFRVLADNTANGWTNSGWVVQKGQKIRITARGRIDLGNGNFSTPRGIASLADDKKLIQNSPTGGLVAVIGDDNNDFIFIGDAREIVASRDGTLFLGINEGNLDDNSGAFDVRLEISLDR